MTAVEQILDAGYVEDIISNIGVDPDFKDDLVQDIYVILLEYDQTLLQELVEKKQIKFFISRIITNQYCSKTSPFYKQYKKPLVNKVQTIEQLIEDEDKD